MVILKQVPVFSVQKSADKCVKMTRYKVILAVFILLKFASADSSPEDLIETTTEKLINNKTISELVLQQTETIKKIIAEHKVSVKQEPLQENIPVHKEVDLIKKQEKERAFIEDLSKLCKHYKNHISFTTTEKPKQTIQPFGPPMKPEFLRIKSKTTSTPDTSSKNSNVYIFTQNPSAYIDTNKKLEAAASELQEEIIKPEDTEENTIINTDSQPEVQTKYVKLEPLVLQRTVLSNGKTLYYWYKALPNVQSFIQIPDVPENNKIESVAQPQHDIQNIPLPEQYEIYLDPTTNTLKRNNIKFQPQFFINPVTGLIYQAALPQQFNYHTRNKQEYFITTSTTTTTTEDPRPPVPEYSVEYTRDEENKNKFKHEFRFVVPTIMTKTQISSYPYGMDPYAYLPQNQRPQMMNLPVPYLPNYHMIKSIVIPQKPKEGLELPKQDNQEVNS